MLDIEIDDKSGFCFGVVNAIQKAEEELAKEEVLYCLGDIVHNEKEVDRLHKLGLITINHETFKQLKNVKVLLRAHGEPPSTYEIAKRNNLTLIDASCPVVLKLQSRIRKSYEKSKNDNTQIVIYGRKGHAEVNGLVGQTEDNAIVVENETDILNIDFNKPLHLFSQTTKSLEGFNHLVGKISQYSDNDKFTHSDTICRQVANRIPFITKFAKKKDIVFFVSGIKSSNGIELFNHCKSINPDSYFVSEPDDVKKIDINFSKKIGICGATSTPRWLMEEVEKTLISLSEESL